MIKTTFIPLFLLLPLFVFSQIKPENESKLNFTQVLFEYPFVSSAVKYTVEYSENKDLSFAVPETRQSTQIILSGFDWDKQYYWRYKATGTKGEVLFTSPVYTFTTVLAEWLRPEVFRTIVRQNGKAGDGLVTLDYPRAIVNRAGEVVWYLPDSKAFPAAARPRDLRVTQDNTVTFWVEKQVFETDLYGNILWKGPNKGVVSKDTTEEYHHYFEKLPSGNYLAMGTAYLPVEIPDTFPEHIFKNNLLLSVKNGKNYMKTEFGTLIEYNPKGEIVWSWNSNSYFKPADLLSQHYPNGAPLLSTHMNAASQDVSGEFVYAGFRNIHRIVKIEKKTGKVVAEWGEKLHSGVPSGTGFFRNQHDANVFPNGLIGVFNNDSISNPGVVSSAVVFSQGENPKIMWSLPCDFDGQTDGKSYKGGSVDLIPSGNYLICMGAIPKTVEVNEAKELIWSIQTEQKKKEEKQFSPSVQFKTHYTSGLYPYLTEAGIEAVSLKGKKKKITFSLSNSGTSPEMYSAVIKSESEIIAKKVLSVPAQTTITESIEVFCPDAKTIHWLELTPQHHPGKTIVLKKN